MKEEKKIMELSPATVDEISELFTNDMQNSGANNGDIIRTRLSMEEILLYWVSKIGEKAKVIYQKGSIFGKEFIEVLVEGPKTDTRPEEQDDFSFYDKLMQSTSLSINYRYKSGYNRLQIFVPKKIKVPYMLQVLIVSIFSVFFGLLVKNAFPNFITLYNAFIVPIISAFANCLRLLGLPILFLTVCIGIINVGDFSTLTNMGLKLIKRFFIVSGIALVATTVFLCITKLYEVSLTVDSMKGFYDVYLMVLGIIPENLIIPFLNKNVLQIVFLGAIAGIALLVIKNKTENICQLLEQLKVFTEFLLGIIVKFIPAILFFSIFDIVILSDTKKIVAAVGAILLLFVTSYIIIFLQIFYVSFKCKVKINILVKKIFKTHYTGLITDSAFAAFSENITACDKLGISKKISNFGLAFGQLIFMPGYAIVYLFLSLAVAQMYNIEITIPWLFVLNILCFIFGIAAIPISGCGVPYITILCSQLNLPAEGITMMAGLIIMVEFIGTGANLSSLQMQLMLEAEKENLLDKNKLLDIKK